MTAVKRLLITEDRNIFYILNKKIKCNTLDKIMPKITHIGGPYFSVLSCLLFILLGKDSLKISAIEALTTLTSSHLFVQILKRLCTRPRPYMILPEANTFKYLLRDYSFPSGHATASFSLAVSFSFFFPWFAALFIILAVVISISRIYMGLHYPSDVLIGSSIGIIFSYITHIYVATILF
ncbi:phosphatase PAP2 family protein [Aceticella autotrophica]|uniref:Phosphatase PAP2 family protein n=1 Tax=Aceticella autotrophica TaxID=2755338 RepID=A0A975AVP1_9THEO|nr:phosphatase PAP2 family protein [Aceticella autotrophica]MDI6604788.1 phosphatase PAP2 family protein [Thermoanaerobacteraceae bacterium]QSZ27322.1 phosphatase PAP2 family protein [Aceticella autotrophica]